MLRPSACASFLALLVAVASRAGTEPLSLAPCDDLPEAVAALGCTSEIEAFGVAPVVSLAVAAFLPPGGGARSVLRFARDGGPPRDLPLAGRVLGLAVAPDGTRAYAVVREVDRTGSPRRVGLVSVDLTAARAALGAELPGGARGVAIGSDGATLLLASRDEIRTFRLPGLESGPLFRAPGDNVGVAPVADSSTVLVVQRSQLALLDLSAPQGREGLRLSRAVAAPSPLRGLLASTGRTGPIALSETGSRWCVRAEALPPPPRAPEVRSEPAPVEPAPAAAPVASAPVPPSSVLMDLSPLPPLLPERDTASPAVFGRVEGPAVGEVAAIVFLGPDNVLREAARTVPDPQGRFRVRALPTGAYRVVAAGKGGRVLVCEPPFVTVRVDSSGAIEAPVLNVLSAQ